MTLSIDERARMPQEYAASTEGEIVLQPAGDNSQPFERRFNLWTTVGMAVCIAGTWEGIGAVIFQGFQLGGAPTIVWGYILTTVGMTCVAASLGELASIWPTSGAQYHWTAEFCPRKWRPLVSYCVMWTNLIALILSVVTIAFAIVLQIQGAIIITNPEYVAERWHVALMYWAVLTILLALNIFGVKLFSAINTFTAVLHITFLFVTMIVILATTKEKNTASNVFLEFQDNSGWNNNGIAFCVGIITASAGFGGVHTVVMFSEETKNASTTIPKAILYSVIINGLISFPWVISVLFCTGNLEELLESPLTYISPMGQIYLNSSGNRSLTVFFQVVTFLVGMCGSMDVMGSAGRAVFSAARDKALPRTLSEIHPKWNVPVKSLLVAAVPMYLICLIYIWNTTAFSAFLSAFITAQMLSYAIPIALLLFRLRNPEFQRGPWNLGRFHVVIHTISLAWCVFLVIFTAFPTLLPVTAANMNYSVLINGIVVVLAAVLYLVYARSRFTGPLVEVVDGLSLVREEQIMVKDKELVEKKL
ncbi:amino acid/polyamine transporter I [Hypoxylon crocopeplum]|nr:amino acid/polyamine transporter I [Hypoxylon crocopeplum]